jgi:hypothetical protein
LVDKSSQWSKSSLDVRMALRFLNQSLELIKLLWIGLIDSNIGFVALEENNVAVKIKDKRPKVSVNL